MKIQLEKQKRNHELLLAFAEKYPSVQQHFIPLGDTSASAVVWINCNEGVLAEIGQALGRDGWTCSPDGSYYKWEKVIDEVEVSLWHVSKRPSEIQRPVNATEWPLQIESAIPTTSDDDITV